MSESTNDFPRRGKVDEWTDAERAIQDAVDVVERAGAHPLLTDAVILLAEARAKVADFVDGPEHPIARFRAEHPMVLRQEHPAAPAPADLVRQEDTYGCMVAAIAMAMGLSYQDAKALLHPWFFRDGARGIGQSEMDSLLAEHGYAVARRFEHYHPACTQRAAWPPAPWAEAHIANVLTSQSHAVVMRGDGRVLDPWYGERASLREYERVYWVASVHRIRDPLPEFVSPTSPGRAPSKTCTCREAWPSTPSPEPPDA